MPYTHTPETLTDTLILDPTGREAGYPVRLFRALDETNTHFITLHAEDLDPDVFAVPSIPRQMTTPREYLAVRHPQFFQAVEAGRVLWKPVSKQKPDGALLIRSGKDEADDGYYQEITKLLGKSDQPNEDAEEEKRRRRIEQTKLDDYWQEVWRRLWPSTQPVRPQRKKQPGPVME